ncbi:MAG: hypothetical protein P2A85_09940 [Microcoleus anatoxicus]|uniref:hypothetical protein n=1 Tax=Microcoleus anatoxicus TaxID=2705319 RepID=UPI00366CA0A7
MKSSTHGGGFCLCRRGLNRRVIVNQTEFKGPGGWKPRLHKRCPPDADEDGIWGWKIIG